MRSVFVRRRQRRQAQPVWMGGLDTSDPGLPVSRNPRYGFDAEEQFRKSYSGADVHRSSSDVASGMRTRIQASSWDLAAGVGSLTDRPVSMGMGPPAASISSRPMSSGRASRSPIQAVTGRRPTTAGAATTRNMHLPLHDIHSDGGAHTDRARRRGTPRSRDGLRSGHMTDRPLLPARQQKTMFSTLQVRVLSIRSEMAEMQRGTEQNEAVWNGLIALGMQGMTQTSKPIKMSVNESVNVPEAVYSFDMQGHTYSSLLAVKFLLLKRREPVPPGHPERPPQTEELGNGDVDISMVAQAGGDRVVSCKVSSSDPAKRPSEVFLHVRIIMRRADFQFSYLGDCPVFKKAGFVISSRGLMKCPHVFKKKGLPHEKTMRDLEVLADVTKEEAAPEGMRVLRAHIHGHSHKYTVKRYQVMQTNARRMLISELDGLMDCPSHLAVSPLDAFLEGLEVAIVFDDNGGRYLSEVVGTRSKFSEMNLSIVVRQVLNALRFLHETKLRIHNDIDPRNILVLRSGEVRLSGFGYSSKNTNAHSKANKFAGPFVHMSPERLLGLECSYAADVWSVGILAMTLLHGKPPYNMSQYSGPDALFKFKQMIVTEHSPSIPRGDEYSDEVRLFVDSCLHKNIKLRPTVSALITHSFIATWDGYHNNVLGRWISKNEIRSFQRPVKEVPEEIPKMTFRGQPVSDELAHVVRTADSPP